MGKKRKTSADLPFKVLLADDNVRLRNQLALLFQKNKFEEKVEVTECGSLDESLSKLRNVQFDLIILDMRMPEKRGKTVKRDAGLVVTQLLRQLALVSADTVVVVFTAYPTVKDSFAVSGLGGYYLPKIMLKEKVAEELVAQTLEIVKRKRESKAQSQQPWLAQNYEQLVRQFGGKTVAVVNRKIAEKKGLRGGKCIGECMVFSARSARQLQKMIIENPEFWRATPILLDVFEEED